MDIEGLQHVTDPETGRIYAIPAGGSDDDGSRNGDDSTQTQDEHDGGTDGQDADGHDDSPLEGQDDLGDKGKKALDAMKRERNEAKKQLRSMQQELETLRKKQQAPAGTPDGDDGDDGVDDVRKELTEQFTAKIVDMSIQTEAAKAGFRNPDIAVKLVDRALIDVGDEGTVNSDELKEALADLAEREPGLLAQRQGGFTGTGDGGDRNGGASTKPKKLTREQYMALPLADRISAQQEGRF